MEDIEGTENMDDFEYTEKIEYMKKNGSFWEQK